MIWWIIGTPLTLAALGYCALVWAFWQPWRRFLRTPWTSEEDARLERLWFSVASQRDFERALPGRKYDAARRRAERKWGVGSRPQQPKSRNNGPKLNGWPKHNPPSARARIRMALAARKSVEVALPTEPVLSRSRIAEIQGRAAQE